MDRMKIKEISKIDKGVEIIMNKPQRAVYEIQQCKNVTENFNHLKELADNQLSYTQMGATIHVLQVLIQQNQNYAAAFLPVIFKLKVLMSIVGEENA